MQALPSAWVLLALGACGGRVLPVDDTDAAPADNASRPSLILGPPVAPRALACLPCGQDRDCGPGAGCVATDAVGYCSPGCTKEGFCAPDRVCSGVDNPDGESWRACVPRGGCY